MEEKETKLKRRHEQEREGRQNESEVQKSKVGGKNNFKIIALISIFVYLARLFNTMHFLVSKKLYRMYQITEVLYCSCLY